MIDATSVQGLIGADVLDSEGEKIGTVGQIFVSPSDGLPHWVAVRHAVGHDWLAPLFDATSAGTAVTLPFDKKTIKHAPRTDAANGLTPEQDAVLSAYYDEALPAPSAADPEGAEPHDEVDLPEDTPREGMAPAAEWGRSGSGSPGSGSPDLDSPDLDSPDLDSSGSHEGPRHAL